MKAKKLLLKQLLMDIAGETRAVAYLGHGQEKACF